MPRPIRATTHLAHLSHNLALAKALAPRANTFAVVKANAYGHGIAHAIRAFCDADGLALIEIENAVRLRELGWTKPILLLEGCFDAHDWKTASELALTVVIHCDEQLSALEALPLSHRMNVFLKFNTGMNRLGFPMARVASVCERATRCAAIGSITLMTHFARADEPDGVREQLRVFNEATRGLPFAKSVANSAACCQIDATDAAMQGNVGPGDWTRPGIMLYGATPFTHSTRSAASLGLKAAMTLATEVIGIQSLSPGDAVGYGGTYVATKPERIAVIAAGYADGYPRHAPTGTPILVDGVRTRIVGRVSMDKITVDISEIPSAHIGSVVELFGPSLAVDEVANAAGTIGYELLTAVALRVPIQTH